VPFGARKAATVLESTQQSNQSSSFFETFELVGIYRGPVGGVKPDKRHDVLDLELGGKLEVRTATGFQTVLWIV